MSKKPEKNMDTQKRDLYDQLISILGYLKSNQDVSPVLQKSCEQVIQTTLNSDFSKEKVPVSKLFEKIERLSFSDYAQKAQTLLSAKTKKNSPTN